MDQFSCIIYPLLFDFLSKSLRLEELPYVYS